MEPEIRSRFLSFAYKQDFLMHSLSGELGIKTSLYLVFTAFLFGAGVQTINIAVNSLSRGGGFVVSMVGVSLALSMLAALCFLMAARIKKFKMLPSIQELIDFMYDKVSTDRDKEFDEAIIFDLEEIVESNKVSNEKTGYWISLGGPFLMVSALVLTVAAARMVYVLLIHPF